MRVAYLVAEDADGVAYGDPRDGTNLEPSAAFGTCQ
jgi:hypothetical protein